MKLTTTKNLLLTISLLFLSNLGFAEQQKIGLPMLLKDFSIQIDEVIYGITNIDECDLSTGIPLKLDNDDKPKELKYAVGNASPNPQQYQDTNFVWTQFVKTIPKNFLENEHTLHIIEVL